MKVSSILASMLAALTFTVAGAACAQATVKIGTTPTSAPFAYLDTKTGQIEGVMADVARAVGEKAGFKVELEAMPFASLISSLTTKRVDIVSAGMFITPARKEVVDFTSPVFAFGEGLVGNKKDAANYVSFNDMKGKRVGAAIGTSVADMVQKHADLFSEVKLYDSSVEMFTDVNNGRIDLGVIDFPIAVQAEKLGNYPNLHVIRSYKTQQANDVGMAIRKGDPLLAKVNDAIAKMKADGTLAGILREWGLQ